MTELFSSLGIEWQVMLAQLVNFAILFAVLSKFVYKPVMKVIAERQEKVILAVAREKESAERFAATAGEQEKLLTAARTESQKIIETAKQGGEELKKKMIVDARTEITRLWGETDKRLATEKARLVGEARRELGAVVVEAIERALGDALDARAQGRMVEQALAIIREKEKKV